MSTVMTNTAPTTATMPADLPASIADSPLAALPAVLARAPRKHLALTVLATIAVVFALDWAQGFVISLLLGVLFAYTLNPLVAWLERIRLPRLAGTTLVMLGVVGALVMGTYSLRGQIETIFDQLPEAAQKISARMTRLGKVQGNTMQTVQSVANVIEKAAHQAEATAGAANSRPAATRFVSEASGFRLGNFLWAGSMGIAGLMAQASMVILLTFFLLLGGNDYKRKLVRLAGPTLAKRKITVRILDQINASIQRYMFMLLATNLLVGLLTWLALRAFGLENAGAWAVAAGLLHVIPYFGPALTAGAIGLAGFMQFDTPTTGLLLAATSLGIATFVGTFVATWMIGRTARINVTALFVALLFWGWLWGVWGMLLSIPITVIVKVLAQHVPSLDAVAELLSDGDNASNGGAKAPQLNSNH
ncbi:MAG TPA: AI-2E family transporter [Rhodocyclaceae bacterium]|nr:AI-2E family transporter [Rhodocyclaceae bacterium]